MRSWKLARVSLALTASLAFAARAAAAAGLAVFPVQATNLEPGEADAIGVLMAGAYAREAGADVLRPAQVVKATKDVEPAGGGPAVAAALGLSEYIEVTAVRLASKIAISTTLKRADGSFVYGAELTAASLDDVEQATARLARALYRRVPPSETQTLHTVTVTEGKVPNRTFSETVWGLKTGVFQPLASNTDLRPQLILGFDWRFEALKYFLEFGVGMTLPSNDLGRGEAYGGVWAELGGSYYLTDGFISPYVGAGVSPRLMGGLEDNNVVKAAVYGQAGLMFFRQSHTRLYTEVRVVQNVIPFENKRGQDVFPTELGLNVGIGW
jgi:hypothetical protein